MKKKRDNQKIIGLIMLIFIVLGFSKIAIAIDMIDEITICNKYINMRVFTSDYQLKNYRIPCQVMLGNNSFWPSRTTSWKHQPPTLQTVASTVKRPKWIKYGEASYYANRFHGKSTASGKLYNRHKLTAAHRTLPFGTRVKVTFLRTGKSTKVLINDRGPHIKRRIIDLSRKAAANIGLLRYGRGKVRLEK